MPFLLSFIGRPSGLVLVSGLPLARLAARNCTVEQAAKLQEASKHENDSLEYPTTVLLRSQVHFILAEICGNRCLEAIAKSLLLLLRQNTLSFEPPTDEIHPAGLHDKLIQAVVDGDEDKAEVTKAVVAT
mgnify:CR=1 FL=1